MKLSFVIPAHNEEKYLGDCLSSIQKAIRNKPAHYETEILVINNASTDKTKEVAAGFPEVRVVDEHKKGLTKARQRGLEETRSDLLAYIDADCRIPEHWFQILEHEFATTKDLVCLSGPYRYHDLPPFKKLVAELGWDIFVPVLRFFVPYLVLGGNFAAKREALVAMGGFNTDIHFYGEDMDIAWRLHRLGRVRFRMDFFVHTSGRRLSTEGLIKTYFKYAVNSLSEIIFHKPVHKKYKDVR